MTDVPPPFATGDLAAPLTLPASDPDDPMAKLRALQAERRRLELRRIELVVELTNARRVVARFEQEASASLQGPVEAILFARAASNAAELAIAARIVEQRLRHIELELPSAFGRTALEVTRR